MHPAYSVIFFTTASGAGYGLLALLGILRPLDLVPSNRWFALIALALALGLIGFGLLSSTLHLKRPGRAILAFSQWRSSWLSREGVLAVATFVPAGLFAFGWPILERTGAGWTAAGLLAALGAAATVFSTGKIYATLKPIRQWHNGLVVPVYLALALATGAVWLNALVQPHLPASQLTAVVAVGALALAWALKVAYWRSIDAGKSASTLTTATGLPAPLRSLIWPHTEENYLLREFGFRVARRHALKLRSIAIVTGFILPVVLIALGEFVPAGLAVVPAGLAALAASLGAVVERWLFFAEARHTSMLYYGREGA